MNTCSEDCITCSSYIYIYACYSHINLMKILSEFPREFCKIYSYNYCAYCKHYDKKSYINALFIA